MTTLMVLLVSVFLGTPSPVIGGDGGETILGVCPKIYRTNTDYYVYFTPSAIPRGATITGLVPKYSFVSGNTYGLTAFVGTPTEEAAILFNRATISEPFVGDPANVKFYMRFRMPTSFQQPINPVIYGGQCSLIVNWELPIVLKNTPLTGPAEIVVGQTAEYNVTVKDAVDYWTIVSDSSVCEVVGDQDKNTVFVRGLSPGQCIIKRGAGIDSDPKVNIVIDTLSVEIVLSDEAKRAAALQTIINTILLEDK
ncbi:MAG: hypothetical protein V3574_03115 [Candidatus Moraniibacteriota bacterium]